MYIYIYLIYYYQGKTYYRKGASDGPLVVVSPGMETINLREYIGISRYFSSVYFFS
jgi:hypothetical protein